MAQFWILAMVVGYLLHILYLATDKIEILSLSFPIVFGVMAMIYVYKDNKLKTK